MRERRGRGLIGLHFINIFGSSNSATPGALRKREQPRVRADHRSWRDDKSISVDYDWTIQRDMLMHGDSAFPIGSVPRHRTGSKPTNPHSRL